ncbi:hypothetical protein QJS04_geneDACA012864 [Acorus gramineus]|uniref:DUF4283 domain-containing protein n=1 Tax=Acorus gramineus TaxID=55184 RepID=A0AAV9BFP0_ACOGR|nr:hypothetical protein QJS04_geneDACA012864 [Acorus gramineus]
MARVVGSSAGAASSSISHPSPVPGLLANPAHPRPNLSRSNPPRPRSQRINVPPPPVCEEAKPWSSFFKALATKHFNNAVEFFSPIVDGSQKIAILEEDEVVEAEYAWGFILVGIRFEKERLNSIPLWIKFPNLLPLHFWSNTCIGKIARLIGIPLYLDSATALRTRSAYARVCVEVEAGSELPDEVFVEVRNGNREAIRVTYDWKPEACSHCSTFGHEDSICCKHPRFTQPAAKAAPPPPPPPTTNLSHGPSNASTSIPSTKNESAPSLAVETTTTIPAHLDIGDQTITPTTGGVSVSKVVRSLT